MMKLITEHNKEQEEKIEEQVKANPKFALVSDNGFIDVNWLENMAIHSVFLARDKRDEQGRPNRAMDLREYHIDNRQGKATRLILKLPNHPPVKLWVDTNRFSLGVERIEVLYDAENSHRTNR